MKSIQRILAATAATFVVAAHAADEMQPAYYLGVQGGENNLRGGWNGTVSLGPAVTLPGAVTTKRGAQYGVFGGRQTEHARFEVEYQHGGFDITGLKLGPVSQSISSSGHYDAITANAYRVRVRAPCFAIMSALPKLLVGEMMADITPTFGSVNMIGGELDR